AESRDTPTGAPGRPLLQRSGPPEARGHRAVIPMERDHVSKELETVRRRREEAVRVEAELARQQARLEARLAELKRDPAGRRAATTARLERMYGPTRTIADLTETIHAWRGNIPAVSSLWMDV